MLVGFVRSSRDNSFNVLGANKVFVVKIAAGSILGTFAGGRLLGLVPEYVLLPVLAAILVISARKVWMHA